MDLFGIRDVFHGFTHFIRFEVYKWIYTQFKQTNQNIRRIGDSPLREKKKKRLNYSIYEQTKINVSYCRPVKHFSQSGFIGKLQ